jgi:hypothetical protein
MIYRLQRRRSGQEPMASRSPLWRSITTKLAPLPRAFLGPIWARLLDGLIDAGAKTVGFDIRAPALLSLAPTMSSMQQHYDANSSTIAHKAHSGVSPIIGQKLGDR